MGWPTFHPSCYPQMFFCTTRTRNVDPHRTTRPNLDPHGAFTCSHWRDLTQTPAEIAGVVCGTVPTLCTDRRQGPFTRSPLPLVACEHRMAWSKAMAARRRAGILLTVDPKILSRWAHRTMVRQATLVSSRSVQNLYRIHLLDKLLLLSAHELGLSGP